MSEVRLGLYYTKSHEWVKDNGDGTITVGVTDYAQQQLGEVVHVDFPKIGAKRAAGDSVVVVESVKIAADIYTPFAGVVLAVNTVLEDNPAAINDSPYDEGWIVTLRLAAPGAFDRLLDADRYQAEVA